MKSAAKPYHHGDLRRSLLEAGHAILDAGGETELSLRELAKSAGVSAAAPYRHFKSREALVVALAEEGFEALEHEMLAATKKHENDACARLLDVARAYLSLALARPQLFRMMFSAPLGPPNADGTTRACDRVYLLLIEILQKGQGASQIVVASAERQGLLFWATLHGYAMLVIDGKLDWLALSRAEHQAQQNALLGMLFAGLRRP